jgi:hypothetical protein
MGSQQQVVKKNRDANKSRDANKNRDARNYVKQANETSTAIWKAATADTQILCHIVRTPGKK